MRDAPEIDNLVNFPGRTVPHNAEAEMALLGSLISYGSKTFDRIRGSLRPEHFALAEHRRIFETIAGIFERGELVTLVAVRIAFENSRALDAVGGPVYLNQLVDCAATSINGGEYGRMIRELALKREIIAALDANMGRAYDGATDPKDVLESLRAETEAMSAGISDQERTGASAREMLTKPTPPREWLLGTTLCRGYMTVLAAGGGTGKTALAMARVLSLVTGRNLVGAHVHKRCKVLFLAYEDGAAEYERRLKAACLHHGIAPDDVGDRLDFEYYGADQVLAEVAEGGGMRETGFASRLAARIRRDQYDILVVDPFVVASGAPENDNNAVSFVARILTKLAERENIAVLVDHHARKGPATPGDIAASRGASALIDAARVGETLTQMSPDEAKTFDIPEHERWQYVRLDSGKANLAPKHKVRWYRLASVNLGNGTPEYPAGDNVQAVETWTPPDAWDGLSKAVLNRTLDDIDAGTPDGERYSDAPAAKGNAAWRVVQEHAPDKTEKQCREVIRAWITSGLLKVEEYISPNRRAKRYGLAVDPSKRPGTEWS